MVCERKNVGRPLKTNWLKKTSLRVRKNTIVVTIETVKNKGRLLAFIYRTVTWFLRKHQGKRNTAKVKETFRNMNNYVSYSSKLSVSELFGTFWWAPLLFVSDRNSHSQCTGGSYSLLEWLYSKTKVITLTNCNSWNCQFPLCLLTGNTNISKIIFCGSVLELTNMKMLTLNMRDVCKS